MYFDEVYHARTAYEYLHGMQPTEPTHPPLGKLIISIGIAICGMTPFGWRIMGAVFGILMIPAIYCFAKRLFKRTDCAFIASFLLTFDFMHFSYSRIGIIDVFAVFFIMMMYYYMHQYFTMNFNQAGLGRTLVPLFLSGIFFGLGTATKWIAVFGGAGLGVILLTSLGQRFCEYVKARKVLRLRTFSMTNRESKENEVIARTFFRYAAITLLWCVFTFVVIPVIIYLMSYIPFMMVPGPGHNLTDVFGLQKYMYEYHSKMQITHPFSSAWWEWPIIRKPLWLYMGKDVPSGKISSIVAMGNPAIWWLGVPAIITAACIAVYRKEKGMYVVLLAAASQYLPWTTEPTKLTFIFHFFATVPFMILCIAYVLVTLMDKMPKFKYIVLVYLATVVILFAMFYPVLSGAVISKSYAAAYLRWFRCWIFFV
jgi:dolichyl-phosphate-mannose--protein O-mannosyl transferase